MSPYLAVSAFASLERSFVSLSSGSAGLCFRGRPLPLVRDDLLSTHASLSAQDAVWMFLVDRARTGSPQWVVAALGMALPGLRHLSRQLSASSRSCEDADGALIRGFLRALSRLDVTRPAIAMRLLAAARRDAVRSPGTRQKSPEPDPGQRIDGQPTELPDLLLADAVAVGVISILDGRVLAATRSERQPDAVVAAALGLSVSALRSRRSQAGQRLAAALCSGTL